MPNHIKAKYDKLHDYQAFYSRYVQCFYHVYEDENYKFHFVFSRIIPLATFDMLTLSIERRMLYTFIIKSKDGYTISF